MKKNLTSVVCFGEILWDVFPDGRKAGGAPMNVTVNLSKLGVNTLLVSRTGNDEQGQALNDFLKKQQIDTSCLQTDPYYKTGIVEVKVGTNKDARYDIVFPSAWDFIETDDEIVEAVSAAEYFVFGSLACRNHTSRSTLFKMLDKARKKVFDINLRYPHYDKELIESLLLKADMLKVNEEELHILNEWFVGSAETLPIISRKIREKYEIDQLIITLGEKGAMVSYGDDVIRHEGFKVEDTVGSGDAFFAAFLAHQIKGRDIKTALDFACATGAYLATQKGANPQYNESRIIKFMKEKAHEKISLKLHPINK